MFQTPIPTQRVLNKLRANIPRNIRDKVNPIFHAVDGLFKIGLEISLVTSDGVLFPVTSTSLIIESCIMF
jgi:hypothetical protein